MFERRLKIFFGILAGIIAVLIIRAGQIQILEAEDWRKKADDSMRRPSFLKTTRGRILDYHNRELAIDEPCIDAAVDFRAIEKNPRWIREQAISRLVANHPQYKTLDKAERQKLIETECAAVSSDIDEMFKALALESGQSDEEIEEIRQSTLRRVEMRRRMVWYQRYRIALKERTKEESKDEPWYRDFLLSEAPPPQIDNFEIEVSEQIEPHVIVNAISPETHNRLKKKIDRYPGLALIPSVHRYYPYGETACHIIGCLSSVKREDLNDDPWENDPLRQYLYNDLIGRWGAEALCEATLRGSRGKIEKSALNNQVLEQIEPQPGKDVRLSIDIVLQKQLEESFHNVKWYNDNKELVESHAMYGAAVVIDIKTGQIRAMASYPTFNLNAYGQDASRLVTDAINRPLLNRATQSALEPGSTVKPLVGLGALATGHLKLNERIECKGRLVIDGRPMTSGRCWTAGPSFVAQLGRDANHEHIPWNDPHPDGQLNVVDAIQRSCNVFFENMGERMGVDGLTKAYRMFHLGEKTGIGLSERAGHLPSEFKGDSNERSVGWFSSIGQVGIRATPLQMAAAHAAIARDGVYIRPTLIVGGLPNASPAQPENLHIPMEYVQAVKKGMWEVVNTRAGTGNGVRRNDIIFAGKTGTAQASPMTYRDSDGNLQRYELSTRAKENPLMPWYRGSGENQQDVSHAWFVGFAPYDNPKIAFAVMLEYGGGGGSDAKHIVIPLIEACHQLGYL